MQIKPIVIAIDGYSSTGKSSFAKIVANELGYIYIDTGALYRSVTLVALENKLIDSNNKINTESLKLILPKTSINFQINPESGKSETFVNGINVEKKIRTLEISNSVSYIAAIDFIRDYVDSILIKLGENKKVVMDGRDIGTAVFPNAELKIFMTADLQVRTKRRMKEMEERNEKVEYQEVLDNLVKRDDIDQHRKMNPLTKAKDAIVLDNSNMTIEEEVNWILKYIYEHFS